MSQQLEQRAEARSGIAAPGPARGAGSAPPLRWGLLMPASFLVLSFAATLPLWLGPGPRLLGYGADTSMHLWFFAWFPHAISHGINPFVTSLATHPQAANLLWNNANLPLALLAWPLFVGLGPAAGIDLVYVLVLTAAATAMAWQLRPHVRHPSAAWLGGLLFGFGPFAQSELAAGHLTWVNTATLPLGWWVGTRALAAVRSRQRRVPWGLALAGWAVLQYWTSKELLATTLLMAGLLLLLRWRGRARIRLAGLSRALPLLLPALALSGLLMAVPLALQLGSHTPLSRPTVVSTSSNVVDLLQLLVPGYAQLLGIGPLGALSGHFSGILLETDAYLGLPLIALMVLVAVRQRRRRLVRLGAALAALGTLLALGPHLHVAGATTWVPLPWLALQHLPLYAKAVPSRMAVFIAAGAACLLAAGWDQLVEGASRRRRWLVLAVALLPLLPSLGVVAGWEGFRMETPAVLGAAPLRSLPPGSAIVTVPITTRANHGLTMYWQAVSQFRYAQPFGFLLHPGPHGIVTDNNPRSPLERLLAALSEGRAAPPGTDAGAVRAQLRAWGIAALVVVPQARLSEDVSALRGILGRSPEMVEGAAVWLRPGGAAA